MFLLKRRQSTEQSESILISHYRNRICSTAVSQRDWSTPMLRWIFTQKVSPIESQMLHARIYYYGGRYKGESATDSFWFLENTVYSVHSLLFLQSGNYFRIRSTINNINTGLSRMACICDVFVLFSGSKWSQVEANSSKNGTDRDECRLREAGRSFAVHSCWEKSIYTWTKVQISIGRLV